jgi:hypothetical protein
MRITPVQNAFTSGEISPRLQARFDLDAYYTGAAKLLNFVCLPHGPLLRRQGTTFIAEAGSTDVRLIPFKFSAVQSLVIELGNKYARFFFRGGQITNSDGTPYQIATPWTAAQVHELDFAQSGDTIYIVHANVSPRKLVRKANNNWAISEVTFIDKPEKWTGTNWPSHIVFHEQRLYYAATPKQPQTIWASRVGLYDEFTRKFVNDGASIKYVYNESKDRYEGVGSSTYLTYDSTADNFTRKDTKDDKVSDQYSPYSRTDDVTGKEIKYYKFTNSYKTTTYLYQGKKDGEIIYNSEDPAGEVLDDMAIEYTIASDEVNGIRWLKAVDSLTCGTAGAEYRIMPGSPNESISPTNIRVRRQTSYGAMDARVQQIGNGVIFVQRGKTRARIFEYGYTEDQYTAQDLTIMSEHILAGKVKEFDLQTVQDPYLWFVLEDGNLVGLTFEKAQKVNAWHRHSLGGNGKAISLTVVPGSTSDEVWLAVKRVINGKTKVYIEAFIDAFSEVDAPNQGHFTDCHLYYEGTPISRVGGLDHLEGCEVAINIDGWIHPNLTVTGGYIDLQSPGSRISVGLPYESYMESCSVQSSDQVIMGNLKRIYGARISLLNSLGLTAGVVGCPEQTVYMGPTKVMNKAKELFTGTLELSLPASTYNEAQLFVKHDMPLPCEIRAIKYEIEVNQ